MTSPGSLWLPHFALLCSCALFGLGCEEEPGTGAGRDATATDAVIWRDTGLGPDMDAGDPLDGTLPRDAQPQDASELDTGVVDGGSADTGAVDAGPPDSAVIDAGAPDTGPADTGVIDSGPPDIGSIDAGPADTGPPDTGAIDAGPPDTGAVDSGPPDTGVIDAGPPDAGVVGCTNGPGRLLWRLTFPNNNGGYARVEEWQAACAYSVGNQACSLSGEPNDYANWGPGILFNSSRDFFRVRFSVAGLQFTQSTLYIAAHADLSGIPNAMLESPIYGSLQFAPTVPISAHRTYVVDWSAFLSPSDAPSLTAVTLRSIPIGLAVSEIELCVQ